MNESLFDRDGYKCPSCGVSSLHEVIISGDGIEAGTDEWYCTACESEFYNGKSGLALSKQGDY